MDNISLKIFDCKALTIDVTVPLYWNDDDVWAEGSEGDSWEDTTTIKGIFEAPYERADLGIAGQDSSVPAVRFPTARVPHAQEGDEITVHRELPNAAGTIVTTEETYVVGTVMPDGYGVTECTLYEEE